MQIWCQFSFLKVSIPHTIRWYPFHPIYSNMAHIYLRWHILISQGALNFTLPCVPISSNTLLAPGASIMYELGLFYHHEPIHPIPLPHPSKLQMWLGVVWVCPQCASFIFCKNIHMREQQPCFENSWSSWLAQHNMNAQKDDKLNKGQHIFPNDGALSPFWEPICSKFLRNFSAD